jgi:hypothetical protein
MKNWLFALLFSLSCTLVAQDNVFFLDGRCLQGKIASITDSEIRYYAAGSSDSIIRIIPRSQVLLIEYAGEKTEILNRPAHSSTYSPNGQLVQSQILPNELLYVNTLAFANADVSLFYEHFFNSSRFGAGVMGAYNFNHYATVVNGWIASLSNARKRFDFGIYLNIYPGRLKRRTNFFYGAMIKYMSFDYSAVYEEAIAGQTAVRIYYLPAHGQQTAALGQVGFQTTMTQNFFIRTSCGIGGFMLTGNYRKQYNYYLNQTRNAGDPEVHVSVLPKLYVSFDLGYSF